MSKRYLLVADIEATCTNSNEFPRHEMEMIQFGAVMVNMEDYSIVDGFDYYVQPVIHPKMTYFCEELTGITDEILAEKAIPMGEFCNKLNKDLKKYKGQYNWAAWGAFDKRFFVDNLKLRKLSHLYPFNNLDYLNLSMLFKNAQGIKRKMGVKKAMNKCRLEFEGRQHNGYDDAYNTARMLPWILPRKT